MEKIYSKTAPVSATLKAMEIRDVACFPKSRTSVVRTIAATLGFEMDRKYQTNINRENGTIDVIRKA